MTIMKVIFFGNVLVVLVCFAKSEEQQSLLSVDPIPSHRALLGDEYGAELDRTKKEAAENVQVSSKTQVKPKRLSKQGVIGMKKKKKGEKEQKKKKGLKKAIKKKGKRKLKNKSKKKMKKTKKSKKKKKKTKTKNKRQNSARTEKKPNEGPYGYMHPEEIDVCIHFCCLALYLLKVRTFKSLLPTFFDAVASLDLKLSVSE